MNFPRHMPTPTPNIHVDAISVPSESKRRSLLFCVPLGPDDRIRLGRGSRGSSFVFERTEVPGDGAQDTSWDTMVSPFRHFLSIFTLERTVMCSNKFAFFSFIFSRSLRIFVQDGGGEVPKYNPPEKFMCSGVGLLRQGRMGIIEAQRTYLAFIIFKWYTCIKFRR